MTVIGQLREALDRWRRVSGSGTLRNCYFLRRAG